MPRREIYCGNNAREAELLSGAKVIGTRHQCFKKGVGRGLNAPLLKHSPEYEAIDQTKIYCGNKAQLPPDKDRYGTPGECLRKGFGMGQKIKYDREGLQHNPVVVQEGSWYHIFLPTILGPVAGIFRN